MISEWNNLLTNGDVMEGYEDDSTLCTCYGELELWKFGLVELDITLVKNKNIKDFIRILKQKRITFTDIMESKER